MAQFRIRQDDSDDAFAARALATPVKELWDSNTPMTVFHALIPAHRQFKIAVVDNPLVFAIAFDKMQTAHALMQKGIAVDVSLRADALRVALWHSAPVEHLIDTFLIRQDMDFRVTNFNLTPLMIAVLNDDGKTCLELLECGADPQLLQTQTRTTAAGLAHDNAHPAAAEAFNTFCMQEERWPSRQLWIQYCADAPLQLCDGVDASVLLLH